MDYQFLEEDEIFTDDFYFTDEVITYQDIQNLENLYISFTF